MSLIIQTILIICVVSYGLILIYFQRKQHCAALRAASLAAEVALKASIAANDLKRGLEEVHILVNSNLIEAKTNELTQAKGRVSALKRIRRPDETDLKEIELILFRINALEIELSSKNGK